MCKSLVCGVLGDSRVLGVILKVKFGCEGADGRSEFEGSDLQWEQDGELGHDEVVASCRLCVLAMEACVLRPDEVATVLCTFVRRRGLVVNRR